MIEINVQELIQKSVNDIYEQGYKEGYNDGIKNADMLASIKTRPTCIVDRFSGERYVPLSTLIAEIEEKRKQYIPGTDYTDGVIMGIAIVSGIINSHKKAESEG